MTEADPSWLQLGLLFIMAMTIIGVFYNRRSQGKGLGARTTQFTVVVLSLPIILLLAIEEIIGPQSTTALIGTILGFVLSGFRKE